MGRLFDHPFVDSRERVPEHRVLRVAQVETRFHEFVEQIFCQSLVDFQFVLPASEFGVGIFAGQNGESRNRAQEERLEVVAANHNHGIGLGFLQLLAYLTHRRNVGVELLRVLTRRAIKKLRGVHCGVCCDNFSHG